MLKIRQEQFDQLAHDLFKGNTENLVFEVKKAAQSEMSARTGPIIISNEQDEKLSVVKQAVFEDRMIQHINKHFPNHYESLGEENIRELIRYGIERSAPHEFVSERDVCKFIDLMLCFGVEFDTDSKHDWATEILAEKSWIDASTKIDALFKEGVRQLQK